MSWNPFASPKILGIPPNFQEIRQRTPKIFGIPLGFLTNPRFFPEFFRNCKNF
jgi:hypothetical protein